MTWGYPKRSGREWSVWMDRSWEILAVRVRSKKKRGEGGAYHGLETLGAQLEKLGDGPDGDIVRDHAAKALGHLLLHEILEREAGGKEQVLDGRVGVESQLANELVELKDHVNEPG